MMNSAVKALEATVGMTDELMKAIEAANERIKHVDALSKGSARKTLIGTLTPAMFADLDGSSECALVFDQNGLDYADDCLDEALAEAA